MILLSSEANPKIRAGHSFGANRDVSGEAVFTTSLVGYNESLTDPSYRGQILVFSQPLIGNYGVPCAEARDEFNLLKYFESEYMQPAGVVVADAAKKYSHWTAVRSLGEWCKQQGVPAITGVDTRAIVTILREQGSPLAKITVGEDYDADQDEAFQDPAGVNLVKQVSTKAPFHVASSGDVHVALVDCGVKEGILRSLTRRGASVTVYVIFYFSFHPSLNLSYRGRHISELLISQENAYTGTFTDSPGTSQLTNMLITSMAYLSATGQVTRLIASPPSKHFEMS